MARQKRDKTLEVELAAILSGIFEDLTVEVSHSDRWNRMCATFRWAGFEGLLPEERFHRLAAAIPQEFRETRMAGFVWLELGPNESVESYLGLPRSEDVADDEADIYAELVKLKFFDGLAGKMSPSPEETCDGDLSLSEAVLLDGGYPPARIRQAKLVFIRHGAYCDCQVLQTVRSRLEELYADAA
jgi:hypothetical protein